jgi:hypothetical protein
MPAIALKGPTPLQPSSNYKWTALANTTAAVFMSQLDGSIVLIALPAIFAGIRLDPLEPQNIGFLLWMLMGYRLVQAVLAVSVGRLGDMFGRVRIYNAGFLHWTPGCCTRAFPTRSRRSWQHCRRSPRCSVRCSGSIRSSICSASTTPFTTCPPRAVGLSPGGHSSRT